MPSAPIQLVVGLGNPGNTYRDTRHNVGFMVLDHWAFCASVPWEKCPLTEADWLKLPDSGVRLLKPMSFMNRSGTPAAKVARYFKIEPESVLVILDDMALPLGRLRFREKGSHGGHNGLGSIIQEFGTQEIPRLRVGIGPISAASVSVAAGGKSSQTPSIPLVPHVLGQFLKDELSTVDEMIKKATQAVRCAVDENLEIAKNRFNPL